MATNQILGDAIERIADLEAQLAESQQALSEREADFYQAERAIERVNKGWIKIKKERDEALEKGLEYQKIAHHENNEADKTRIELMEALERESALNAKVEELGKAAIEIARTVEELRQEKDWLLEKYHSNAPPDR